MLEKRLAPVMELLRRQTLVEQLVDRTEDRAGLGADVLHRRHRTALAEALSRLHPADIAHLLKEAYLTYRAAVHQLNLQEKPAKVPENKFRNLREKVEKIWDDFVGIK